MAERKGVVVVGETEGAVMKLLVRALVVAPSS